MVIVVNYRKVVYALVAGSILFTTFVLYQLGTAWTGLSIKEQAMIRYAAFISNEEFISFTAIDINTTFRLPTDPAYIHRMRHTKPKDVTYLRNHEDIEARGEQGNCTSAIEVLGWIMDEVNKENGTMMIAYGELIHFHREKDFVDKETGKYIDDDFDNFVSVGTFRLVADMEPELFKRFGWTMRVFVNRHGYATFMQTIASCGHTLIGLGGKAESSEPTIEIYPLARSLDGPGGIPVVKDLWMCSSFAESMILPPNHISFKSAATSRPLQLQTPHKSFDFLECIYGNWTVPSSNHSAFNTQCF